MAKSFFAQQNISYQERDVTQNEEFMLELKNLAGRFITPTLWINGKVWIGFGNNIQEIKTYLQQKGYLQGKA